MSTVRRLSLVGVADGDLTNASAGPGDTPFNIINGDLDVETDAAFNGKAIQVAQVSGSAANAEWDLPADVTESGGRIAFIHPGVQGASWPLFGTTPLLGGFGYRIDLSGPGKLRVRNNANAQIGSDGTTTLTGGTKYYVQWTQTATAFHLELRSAAFALLETMDRTDTFGPSGKLKPGNTLSTPTLPATFKFGELEFRDDPSLPGAWVEWEPEPILHAAQIELPRRSSVGVGLVTEATTDVQLVASLSSDLSSPINGTVVAPAASGWANARVTGLTPDTVYHLGLLLDGVDPGWRGQIRTKPLLNDPLTYPVLFGSCQETGSNHVVFDQMATVSARFLAHMGDLGYLDTTDEALWRAGHVSSLAAAKMQGLLAGTPMRYVPDNHDWGGEFSDASSPVGAFVPGALREISPAGLNDGVGLWSSWVLGRVRYIMLDTRSQRDAYDATNSPTKTMLGSTQKAWLKFMLQHAAEPVIVIWSSIIWTGGGGADRWASYPNEWNELVAFVTGLPNVQAKIFVGSGDFHAVAGHSGVGDPMGVPRVVGAAFDSGGTTSPEAWDAGQHGNTAGRGQFGVLEITDAGADVTVHFEGRQDDGTVLVEMDAEYGTAAPPIVYRWSGKGLTPGATVAAGMTGSGGDSEITAVNGTAPTLAAWDERGNWIHFPADDASYVVLATYDDAMPTQAWSLYLNAPTAGANRLLTAWDGTRSAVAYVVDVDASGVVSISTGAGAFLGVVPVPITFGATNYRLDVILDHGDISVLLYDEASSEMLGYVTGVLPQEFTPNELWVGATFAFSHPELRIGQFRRTNAGQAISALAAAGSGSHRGKWIGGSTVPGGTPLSEVVGWSS